MIGTRSLFFSTACGETTTCTDCDILIGKPRNVTIHIYICIHPRPCPRLCCLPNAAHVENAWPFFNHDYGDSDGAGTAEFAPNNLQMIFTLQLVLLHLEALPTVEPIQGIKTLRKSPLKCFRIDDFWN